MRFMHERAMKICTKRLHAVSLDGFGADGNSKDGLKHWCRECVSTHQRRRYLVRRYG